MIRIIICRRKTSETLLSTICAGVSIFATSIFSSELSRMVCTMPHREPLSLRKRVDQRKKLLRHYYPQFVLKMDILPADLLQSSCP